MDEADEFGRTPWLIEAAITDPVRVTVRVTVTIPTGQIWDDKAIGDATEVAQMQAATAMNHLNKCRQIAADKVPF